MDVMPHEFPPRCSCTFVNANGLAITVATLDELEKRLKKNKEGLGDKKLKCWDIPLRCLLQYSGIKGRLSDTENFNCYSCSTVKVTEDHSSRNVVINGDKRETVTTFCYLGDVIGQSGRSADAVTHHIHSTWEMFHEL